MPYIWTAKVGDILERVERARVVLNLHHAFPTELDGRGFMQRMRD